MSAEKFPDDPEPNFTDDVRPICTGPECSDVGAVPVSDIESWVCPSCGRITDRYYRTSRAFTDSPVEIDPDDIVRVVGEMFTSDGYRALLDLPYDAKDDLKDLPFRETERRWNDDIGYWVIATYAKQRAIDHMTDRGWPVVDLVQLRRDHLGNDQPQD